MEIFFTIFAKLVPFYIVILLGFIAGKYLNVKKEIIAPLLIYIIAPAVIFTGGYTIKISYGTLSLPILFFIISSCLSLLIFYLAGFIWKGATRNILALIAGTGNVGYFGLPVAISIFGNSSVGIVALILMGIYLFQNSIGFYLTSRFHYTTAESLKKVLKLPLLYAFFLGLIINALGIKLGRTYFEAFGNFRGAYSVLGMMIIGLGISDIKIYKFDKKFLGISFLTKFILWPLIILAVILFDRQFLNLYDSNIYKIMMLMAIVPFAADAVSYASLLKAEPEKTSLAVLLSTIFALFYIPLITVYFLK